MNQREKNLLRAAIAMKKSILAQGFFDVQDILDSLEGITPDDIDKAINAYSETEKGKG